MSVNNDKIKWLFKRIHCPVLVTHVQKRLIQSGRGAEEGYSDVQGNGELNLGEAIDYLA